MSIKKFYTGVYVGDNLGVGTTSPQEKLDISAGNIRLDDNQRISWSSSDSNIGRVRITGNESNDFITIATDNSERVRINNTGVGIGTTSPAAKLDVVTTTFSNSFVDIQNLKYTTFDVLKFGYTGSTGSIRTGTIDSGIFGFAVNTGDGTERMRINTIGNVGIGTNDPDAKLHVKSSNSGATTQSGTLIVEAGSSPSIQLLSANSQTQTIKFGDPQDGDAGRISYSHSTNDMTLVTNGGDRVTIDDTGNVGIGNTSPLNKLQVSDGSVGIDSQYMIRDNRNNTILQQSANTAASNRSLTIGNATYSNVIIPNGNVGIGTTSPSAKLEVSGDLRISSDQTSLIKISNESNEDYFTVSQSTNNKPTLSLGDIDEQYGTLLTVDVESEEVVIFTNGTVKIGDNGFGNSTQFIVDDVNQKFTFTNGNVGIGTTTPSQKLEVDGQVLSDGYRLAAMQTAPAARNSTGTLGEIVIDGNHMYVCYATNSWSRVALATSW